MILTRDNILRYVKEQKAVTPTMISEAFDTSTMIASAALSELAKDKLILITHLKLSSSPYYYDPKQKDYLIELGEKHLSKHDKDIFNKLRQTQVLSDNSLSIQERLAIERIRDFAISLEINLSGKELKFWVWFQRNLAETKSQIQDAMKGSVKTAPQSNKTKIKPPVQQTIVQEIKKEVKEVIPQQTRQVQQQTTPRKQERLVPQFTQNTIQEEQNKEELFIDNYFRQNYLNLERKNKIEKGVEFELSVTINKIKILFDSFYYYKKPTESDIMKFYTSSQRPKIIFIQNAPKKLLKLSENLENLTVVNI
jgi:hypothetical protein